MAARRYIKLTGTELGDFLKGTNKHDYIDAGAGDDTILSGAKRDIIYAGDGNDYINSRQGHDKVDAGAGDDYVKTGRGRDRVDGGEGNDTVFAGRGRDTIDGGDGDDRLNAGRGNDSVDGGSGDDTILGGEGNDNFDGGDDFDLVVYRGRLDDYTITANDDGSWTVSSDFFKDRGTDTFIHVEVLYFEKDDIYVYLEPQNSAPIARDDELETTEDNALLIDPASLLANDTDADGDPLSIMRFDGASALGATITQTADGIRYDQGTLFQSLKQGETVSDSFTYTISDGSGETSTATATVTINGTNDVPSLWLEAVVDIEENTSFITDAAGSDIDDDAFVFEISGGEDAHLFEIDATTGDIQFIDAPDYETPLDSDGDNTYHVDISVVDDWGATDTQQLAINVTDVDETPDVDGRINELHYNNVGEDVGEFVEVRVRAGDDTSLLKLDLYDAGSGRIQRSVTAETATKTSDAGYDYYVFHFEGDTLPEAGGYALTNGTKVLEFLSHEGRFIANDGAALGLRADDIEVSETNETQIGHSLQRNEDGTWRDPGQNTSGLSNDAQPEFNVRLNEFHYDNASTDENEFIEVRADIGTDISDISIYLYNGASGSSYDAHSLQGLSVTYEAGYAYYVWDLPTNGLQNGGAKADGIVLAQGDNILEFVSYEGTITAKYGIAAGYTSTDINVREGNSTGIDDSVQRNTFGVWMQPELATKGGANTDHFEVQLEARINEIHYDNAGADIGEFVEIRVGQGQNVDLVTLELYNGGNGAVYHTASLADYDVNSSADGFDFYVIDDIQLQDGSPDGMALAYDGTVIEFLSYEGTFSASNGTAEGLTAYDIGVSEPEFGLAGYSLQRNSDGTWFDPSPETRGESNLTEDLLLG